ncbi:hypothetical protein ACS0TY_006858 [Phlomoides rotata]
MRVGEGEAERRVDLRDLDSEWTPVRHKPKPVTHGRRIDNGSNPISTKWLEVWNPVKECVTFFFTNFPDTCNHHILINRFKEIAEVKDLFIPNRLDKKGRTFGFVRFSGKINTPHVERDLNNIWFGSYKLRANLSKFARKGPQTERKEKGIHISGSNGTGILGAMRLESKSYLQAVCMNEERKSNKEQRTEAKDKSAGISYTSSEEDREFLSRYFSGQLKGAYNWPDVQEDIQEASNGSFNVKFRGGDLVFIYPQDDLTVNGEDLELISKWFGFLEPWCKKDVHNIRVVWTQWYGVPMHAWNKKKNRLVTLKFGKMVKADENTLNKQNVRRARILIRTPLPEVPKNPFPVWVDGRRFLIRVREEVDWEEDSPADWSEGGVIDSDEEQCDWWRSEEDTDEEQEMTGLAPEVRSDKDKSLEVLKADNTTPSDAIGIGLVSSTINEEETSVHDLGESREKVNEASTPKDRGVQESECQPFFTSSQETTINHCNKPQILLSGPSMGLKAQTVDLSVVRTNTEPNPEIPPTDEYVPITSPTKKSPGTNNKSTMHSSHAKVTTSLSSDSHMDTENSLSEDSVDSGGLVKEVESSAPTSLRKPRPPMSW